MIKAAATAALRMLKPGTSVAAALATRRGSALETWRGLVRDHVGGKAINLDALEDAGLQLRLADVAGTFARDCKTLQEHDEHQAHGDKLQAEAARLLPAQEAALRELERIERDMPRLRQESGSSTWTGIQASYSLSTAQGIRTRHPRLFDDLSANEGEAIAASTLARDEVQPEPQPTGPRAPRGGAVALEASWE